MAYPGQIGRILRATWSIFWLIMCAAYVAFLTTTFTVKPAEISLRTFQDLANTKDFKIGIFNRPGALVNMFITNRNSFVQEVWAKFLIQNKTENSTFDGPIPNQAKRVLEGHYAFLSGYCITLGICDDVLLDYLSDIRVNRLDIPELSGLSFVSTPKDIFYHRDLYRVLLNAEEMGILNYLRELHFRPMLMKKLENNKINKGNKIVTISRILLPVYISIAGVSVSAICLGLEVMYSSWRRMYVRLYKVKT